MRANVGMFPHRARILHATPGAADVYGTPQPGWVEGPEVPARLEQTDAAEVTVGAEVQTADWRISILGDPPLDGRDRVAVDGVVYEVVGPPAKATARLGVHHVEARLRSVG